jgi:hypothetical protein
MGLFMNITTHHDRVTNERMINDFTPITKFIISSLSSNNKEVRSCTQRCFLHMTVNEGTHEPMRSNPELMLALCDAKHAETPHCARTLYNICDYGRFSALSALSALSIPISEPPLDLLFFCSRSYRFHDSIVLAMIREFPEQLTKYVRRRASDASDGSAKGRRVSGAHGRRTWADHIGGAHGRSTSAAHIGGRLAYHPPTTRHTLT